MSIKSQKSQGVKAGKLVVVTTRKETSRLLTKKKLEKLKELCFEISKAKNYFSKKYNTLSGMALIKNYRKTVRDELVKTKKPFPFKSKLQARQWKTCLDEVFFNISSRYALIIDELKKNLSKNPRFSDDEKHYLRVVFKYPDVVSNICLNKKINGHIKGFEHLSTATLHKWLRRQFRKSFSRISRGSFNKINSFSCDSSMFSFCDGHIGVMGLEKGKRICIPLVNKKLSVGDFQGNLKFVLRTHKGIIEVHRTICTLVDRPKKLAEASSDSKICGVDIGFSTAFSCSSDNEYGKQLGEMLISESNRLSEKNAKRNQYNATIRNLSEKMKNIKDEERKKKLNLKIKKISLNNLGKKKYFNQKHFYKVKIKDYVNKSFNNLLKNEAPEIVAIEKLDFKGSKKPLNKKVKRYFSSWVKGVIKNKINLSCSQNSVLAVEVNTAYSSQTCLCGSLETKRNNDRLHCRSCGKDWNANTLAGKNLKLRLTDDSIHLYMPYQQVKEVLISRYQKRMRLPIQDLTGPSSEASRSEIILKGIGE